MPESSISVHAREILASADFKIAVDKPENLISMMVGLDRIKSFHEITNRIFNNIGVSGNIQKSFLEIVLGEYGSGKSHIAYLLKHNILNSCEDTIVINVQITASAYFPEMVAAFLRNMYLSNSESNALYGIEFNAYTQLLTRMGGFYELQRNIQCLVQGIPAIAADDFAIAAGEAGTECPSGERMNRFIEAWVQNSEPNVALEVFLMVLRTFYRAGFTRVVLLLDEFEAMQSLGGADDKYKKSLQTFHQMMDHFKTKRELPCIHTVAFSTKTWHEKLKAELPAVGQRFEAVTVLGDMTDTDICAMVYRLIYLYAIAYPTSRPVSAEEVTKICNEVILDTTRRYLVREIKSNIIQKINLLFSSQNA